MKNKFRFIFRRACLSILTALLFSFTVNAQNVTVKGVIKDKKTNDPIVGVSVYIKGTTVGTSTDFDGVYELSAPAGSTLSISFIGYTTQEILAKDMPATLIMEEDAMMLDDAVVVGYATGSKRTISGAVQKLGKEEMNVGVVNSPLEAMKGKVAGVVIQKSGGDPTAGPSIRIRGTTSLSGGNDPLVVVDGVFGDLTLLSSLSPSDIESFTVLKDASETAQYGSRGASGVIVVTTQKGKAGSKQLSYDGTFGLEAVYKNIEMLSASGYREAVQAGGYTNALDKGNNTNFIEEMQNIGYTQNHRISLGGGTESSNYRASVGVIDQKGIIKNNKMQNFTAKLDMTQKYFDNKLSIDMGIFGSKKEQRYLNDHKKTFYSAASFNPTLSALQNADGTWEEDPNANEVENPMGRLTIDDRESSAYAVTHGRLTWSITSNLKFSAFGSYSYNSKENSKYVPTNIKAGIRDNGYGERKQEYNESTMGNLSLTYKKIFAKHRIDALGLVEAQEYKMRKFNAQARSFGSDYFVTDNLGAGAIVKYGDVGSEKTKYNLMSYLGRFNYVYDNKYIATVNVRADGSSKLGSNNKWGFFPSVSAAWVVKEESFMKEIDAIDEFKIRTGYGVTGNQDAISPYNSLYLMKPNGLTSVNGKPTVTYGYDRNPNPDLRWETKHMFDIGFDAAFLKNRVTVNFDFYQSTTKDLLYNYEVPVPPFAHDKLLANLGEMKNTGVELSIGVTPLRTTDMELTVSANIAFQKNKLVSLTGDYNGQTLTPGEYMSLGSFSGAGAVGGNNNVVYQLVGEALGVFYLPKSNGLVNDGLGGYTYNLVNIDEDPEISTDNGKDRYIAGQAVPKMFLGGNINFRYKRFDVQTQFNGAFGHKIFNGTSLSYMNMNTFPTYNVLPDAPKQNIRDNKVSDYWLEKGDYLNIAYLSLGYNVDVSKMKTWVNSIRVSASVNNLYTFTNYSGLSPMINSTTVGDTLGLDDKQFYPLTRTFSIGLSVNF